MDNEKGNGSVNEDAPWVLDLSWDDATWILTASFIIFTMQTGFGMLESGCVSMLNETNIMMKNVVDVVFGGLTYWLFGFGMSFGSSKGSSPYFGIGEYAVNADYDIMGPVFASFMFQLSFATTATTIVSGTMAERCNFRAYCIFSMLNTIVYCVPARWIWGPTGFLAEMGVIDIAGSGAVHLLGGVSGFVAAWMLGPRLGRYENGPGSLPLGNATSCIVGLLILWWGWLAFNSGSTFGVSGDKWKFSARAAVSTMISSIGGGLVGSLWALFKPGKLFEVMDIVNPVLGALVGVTAGCALYHTFDAFIVGIVGGIVTIAVGGIPDALRVDDPVSATAVHGFGGVWGMIAVAIFAEDDLGLMGFTKGHSGLYRGGDFYLLKVQAFACLCITVWSASITFTLLWIINKIVPIRTPPHEELLGADFVEHLIRRNHVGLSNVLTALHSNAEIQEIVKESVTIGASNPNHDRILYTLNELRPRKWNMENFNCFKHNNKVRNSISQYQNEDQRLGRKSLGNGWEIPIIAKETPIEVNEAAAFSFYSKITNEVEKNCKNSSIGSNLESNLGSNLRSNFESNLTLKSNFESLESNLRTFGSNVENNVSLVNVNEKNLSITKINNCFSYSRNKF